MRRALTAALLLVAVRARAGNFASFPMGNEAAMTGGAVYATTADAAALYYNPSGLAAIDRSSLDASATAVSLRSASFPGAVRATSSAFTVEGDARNNVFLSVPSTLIVAKRLSPRLGFAAGLFIPRHDQVDATAELAVAGAGYAYSATYTVVETSTSTQAGAGLGLSITPRLRLGLGLFAVYETATASFDFAARLDRGSTGTGIVRRKASVSAVGLQTLFGLQATPVDGLELGAALRLPTLAVGGSSSLTGYDQSTVPTPTLVRTNMPLGGDGALLSPLRAHFGVAYRGSRGWIGVSVERSFAVHGRGSNPSFAPSWNVQLGGRAWLGERVAIGLGVFTDRSATPDAASRGAELDRLDRIGSAKVDYYGATAGVELRRRYMAEGDGEKKRGLDFSTTLAVRFARGTGTVQGALIRPLDDPPNVTTERPTPATATELGLHIGSALYF